MANAEKVIARCRELARISDSSEGTFRPFLSPATRRCQEVVRGWMEFAGMRVSLDNAGNLRGVYPGNGRNAQSLVIGSHLDTVQNAGPFDGILGVAAGIQLVEELADTSLAFDIQVIGFSEEEGVRFGTPFTGSHAIAGTLSEAFLELRDASGISIAHAIREFGLDPLLATSASIMPKPVAFLECHIEQGPVLDQSNESLAIVDSIVGQTRTEVTFTGRANHAGTTPMALRFDALCGAAEWVLGVELAARSAAGLAATVGKLDVTPNGVNIIPGEVTATLDCRHADDSQRANTLGELRDLAAQIAGRRGLTLGWAEVMNQPAVRMDTGLVETLDAAARSCGFTLRRMASGAGHDAMVMAAAMPSVMLFLRSPGGISHHPDEDVLVGDVANALLVAGTFIRRLADSCGERGRS